MAKTIEDVWNTIDDLSQVYATKNSSAFTIDNNITYQNRPNIKSIKNIKNIKYIKNLQQQVEKVPTLKNHKNSEAAQDFLRKINNEPNLYVIFDMAGIIPLFRIKEDLTIEFNPDLKPKEIASEFLNVLVDFIPPNKGRDISNRVSLVHCMAFINKFKESPLVDQLDEETQKLLNKAIKTSERSFY